MIWRIYCLLRENEFRTQIIGTNLIRIEGQRKRERQKEIERDRTRNPGHVTQDHRYLYFTHFFSSRSLFYSPISNIC